MILSVRHGVDSPDAIIKLEHLVRYTATGANRMMNNNSLFAVR